MAIGPQDTVLVPNGSRVMCAVIVATCAAFEAGLVSYGHVDLLLRVTPAVLLVAAVAIVLFWRPRVTVSHAGIEIVNPLRTFRIGWRRVTEIDTKWSLTVRTAEGVVTVWSAPAPGLFTGMSKADALETMFRRSENRDLGHVSSPLTRQGGTAGVVARQWEAHRDAEHADFPALTEWHVATLATLAVLVVLTAVGAFWP